ncbi:hypothetical protein T492DRAFT_1014591 [Pavlovales sp. CCMP2436]|nr:hypothetical protein T492DRAFT_1014591 [Pavlovales sp. CCMP2436]
MAANSAGPSSEACAGPSSAARAGPSAAADVALAHELQVADDAALAAVLQAELDCEIAHELQDELETMGLEEARTAAAKERLARHAGKEISHLGKVTLHKVDAQLRTGTQLGSVLRACRDEAVLGRLCELADAGQKERVHIEIVALLLDEELSRAL